MPWLRRSQRNRSEARPHGFSRSPKELSDEPQITPCSDFRVSESSGKRTSAPSSRPRAAHSRPPAGRLHSLQAVAALRLRILTRLYAAAAGVRSPATFCRPLLFAFLSPATTLAQPKSSSASFRLLWLTQ